MVRLVGGPKIGSPRRSTSMVSKEKKAEQTPPQRFCSVPSKGRNQARPGPAPTPDRHCVSLAASVGCTVRRETARPRLSWQPWPPAQSFTGRGERQMPCAQAGLEKSRRGSGQDVLGQSSRNTQASPVRSGEPDSCSNGSEQGVKEQPS